MKPKNEPVASTVSRRRFVGRMTSGIAAAAFASPAFARQGAQSGGSSGSLPAPEQLRKQDPAIQYPSPPFPAQQQESPGLAGKMSPRPDHGETSYKGSGRLAGRKALVTGAIPE